MDLAELRKIKIFSYIGPLSRLLHDGIASALARWDSLRGSLGMLAIAFRSLPVKEKSVSGLPPPGSPRAALLGGFWTTALAPSERLFTVRDREKANCELLLPLRDGLFPLPVEENTISELLRPELNLSANRKLGRSESSRLENRQFLVSRDAHL